MTAPSSNDLNQLEAQALAELTQSTTATTLEAWRVKYLGRKGTLPQFLRNIKTLPAAGRREAGSRGNAVRQALESAYAERLSQVGSTTSGNARPSQRASRRAAVAAGHYHPLTITIRQIQDIFRKIGFTVVEGPEVEDPRYNFDLLNIPPEHPARAETDTFYLTNGMLLRTQTSPVQLRAVEEHNLRPPFRILSPGRVFRSERTDATHETTFYQFEGLVVGEQVTIADFKGIIETFYSSLFEQSVAIRLRPSYFPFVEPGFEVDIRCVFCGGDGCRLCKHSGWIEVMGAGMVHPQVLRNMKIDPAKYQGFAFGGAVDRLAMLKLGITDIRLFWSGDLRFLRQFS